MKVFACLYILLGSVEGIGQVFPPASSDDLVAECNKGGAVPSIYMLQGLDLSSQVYVITGGDTGMAHAAAISLATKNATIVLGMRGTTGKYLEAVQVIRSKSNNPKVYVFYLDLSSFASVKMFASQVAAKYPVITGMICSAGISGGLFPLTEDGFEMIFQVNYLSHFLLVNMLLPMLKQGHGTIVVASSDWHRIPCGFASLPTNCTDISALPFSATRQFRTKGYGHTNSELAQWLKVFWATELAKRHKEISAFSFNPGFVYTPQTNQSFIWLTPPGVTKEEALKQARQAFKGFQVDIPMTADEGAAAMVYFATAQLHNQSGGYFSLCKPVESAIDTMIQDHGDKFAADYLSALFDLSMHWTSESAQRKVLAQNSVELNSDPCIPSDPSSLQEFEFFRKHVVDSEISLCVMSFNQSYDPTKVDGKKEVGSDFALCALCTMNDMDGCSAVPFHGPYSCDGPTCIAEIRAVQDAMVDKCLGTKSPVTAQVRKCQMAKKCVPHTWSLSMRPPVVTKTSEKTLKRQVNLPSSSSTVNVVPMAAAGLVAALAGAMATFVVLRCTNEDTSKDYKCLEA